jgi:hypothetical protein
MKIFIRFIFVDFDFDIGCKQELDWNRHLSISKIVLILKINYLPNYLEQFIDYFEHFFEIIAGLLDVSKRGNSEH